jgi:chaperonin GroES
MTLQPINDNVVVKIKKVDTNMAQTAGGILIVNNNAKSEKQEQGEVITFGPGRILNDGTLVPVSVEKGDTVIFNKYAGTEIEAGDELYLIIKENDILATIKE